VKVNNFNSFMVINFLLLSGLFVAAGLPSTVSLTEEGTSIQEMLPEDSGKSGVRTEDLIRQFDTLLQGQKLPPEATGFFQDMKGIMEGAAKGQDPQILKEKSRGLLQGMQSYLEKSNQSPEITEIFKSLADMTQPGSTTPTPKEFLQHFDKLLQGNKLPPEAEGLFEAMRGIMQGAGQGPDRQMLKEKSRDLLQGAQPPMEK
jgi:hypothetical protein